MFFFLNCIVSEHNEEDCQLRHTQSEISIFHDFFFFNYTLITTLGFNYSHMKHMALYKEQPSKIF